ncbi:MAG: SUMF1/EgtB/PvdO family nonheme iron enzyme [Reichenbachiella sp.]
MMPRRNTNITFYKLSVIAFLVFLIPMSVFGQSNVHPEASDPGWGSEKTGIPYTKNPAEKDIVYMVYNTNKTSEKLLFYEGKYDPWKTKFNKNNALMHQIYIIPPGTLPISKGVFLDQTEVANIHYAEFLFFLEKDSGKYASKAYEPVIENKYKHKYINDPEFYFFPVTGVSHENAEAYCQWRAKKVNVGLKEMLIGSPKKYRYAGRLPRADEWKKGAGQASSFVKDVHYSLGKNEKEYFEVEIISKRFATAAILENDDLYGYNANFYVEPPIGLEIEIPHYIYSFEPNEKGFYNLYGNVKELLDDGHAIGGSFKTPYVQDMLFEEDDIQSYRTDVGFRCIVEIARRKR